MVTGGSRGLGAALTRALAADNWRVIATARTAADLQALTDQISGPRQPNSPTSGEVVTVTGDVSDADHRRTIVQAAGGRVDVLVNNASALSRPGGGLTRLEDARPADLRFVYDVNVLAPVALVTDLLASLRAAEGVVINISSDAATGPYEGWGVYGSSKAALDQVSNVLGAEHPELAVYALDPGDMRTQMHQEAFPGEDISDRPLPDTVVPAIQRLIAERPPSGRYLAADLLAADRITAEGVLA